MRPSAGQAQKAVEAAGARLTASSAAAGERERRHGEADRRVPQRAQGPQRQRPPPHRDPFLRPAVQLPAPRRRGARHALAASVALQQTRDDDGAGCEDEVEEALVPVVVEALPGVRGGEDVEPELGEGVDGVLVEEVAVIFLFFIFYDFGKK